MNHLLAKMKGRNTDFLKVLSHDDNIFTLPEFSNSKLYSPSYKLEKDEWYKLDSFSTKGFSNDLIGSTFDSTSYNQIVKNQYNKINYLCSKQDDFFLFQKLFASQVLNKKFLDLSPSGEPSLEDKPIIVLNDIVHAVYDINNDTLYFMDFAKIKPMFKGIADLYREATQKEVDTFFENDFISLSGEYSSADIKDLNRKRIALAIDELNEFSSDDKDKIIQYIKEYCKDVPITDGVFQVSTEEQLKQVMYGIGERYYTTRVGKERRLANSVLKMKNK